MHRQTFQPNSLHSAGFVFLINSGKPCGYIRMFKLGHAFHDVVLLTAGEDRRELKRRRAEYTLRHSLT